MIHIRRTSSNTISNTAVVADLETAFSSESGLQNNAFVEQKRAKKKNTVLTLPQANAIQFVALLGDTQKLLAHEVQEDLRTLGASLFKSFNTNDISEVYLTDETSFTGSLTAVLEGILLASYRFDIYKSKAEKANSITVWVNENSINEEVISTIQNLCEGVFLARNLVNEPVITLNAEKFAQRMSDAGKDAGYTTQVLHKDELIKQGFGGLLGVNLGSDDPPTFTVMTWKPEGHKNEKPLVLVGKGVVYDTGGNNLKPGEFMSTMKSDKGGGAAVTGAMYAIAKNKLPLHVIGLVPATDNRIGHNALVADDVITMLDGTTVEIQNTDAEGRLILADALHYAKQFAPELVIDLATLTGAAEMITGPFGIAMMGTADENTKTLLKKCGEEVYERCTELPFWREYDELIKSDIADLKNIGGRTGGAITAGKFLHHFTDYPWIHLDIAGPAFIKAAKGYKSVGGTGVGVRLMFALAERMSK